MDDNDFNLEVFLREFEPRRPRALPSQNVEWRAWHRIAAAAALILALSAATVWIAWRRAAKRSRTQTAASNVASAVNPEHQPSTIELTRAALDDGREFDNEMDSLARRSLPGFKRTDSALRVLAKD